MIMVVPDCAANLSRISPSNENLLS